MLATLARRVDPDAARLAIECALEANRTLLLLDAVPAAQATAHRARELGVRTELLGPIGPRPAQSIVTLANEHRAALIVLGRPRGLLGRWRFRRTARAIRRETDCLVWIAPKG